jgi:alpha-tubulin suppressor-like RCC1 family protein
MSASFNHAAVLLEDGTVWGWGDNTQGQLGDGSTGNFRTSPVRVLGVQLN